MCDISRSRAKRGAHAESVNLRAGRQQISDLKFIQVAAAQDAYTAHARQPELLTDILAVGHDVAAIEPDGGERVTEAIANPPRDFDGGGNSAPRVVGIQQQGVAIERPRDSLEGFLF